MVIDDSGNNYGGWQSIASFQKALRGAKGLPEVTKLSRCRLIVGREA